MCVVVVFTLFFHLSVCFFPRLHQNVIKTGLRKINLSYSHISLADVSKKLAMPMEDTEMIVAKAIADGVIEASIDRKQKSLLSKVRGYSSPVCLCVGGVIRVSIAATARICDV